MKKQEKFEDDEFQVILSKQDYEGLRKCRDDYKDLKSQFEVRTKQYQSQKQSILQKYECLVVESKRLNKEKQEFEELVGRMYSHLEDRKSKVELFYASQLYPARNKQQVKFKKVEDKSFGLGDKLTYSLSLVNELFDMLILALDNEGEKVRSLVKETVGLKQENFRLNVEISQKNERLKALQQQMNKAQQSKQRYKLQISQLKDHLKQLQQSYKLESTQNTSLTHKRDQQTQQLKKKLKELQHQNQSLKKQILLVQQQNIQFRKQNNDFQDEIKEYQEHILMLKQSIQLSSRQKEHARKPSIKSKFQKEDYIKETLIEYMREIRKNLISIGNLSQQEIRQIGTSQLRTLVKFIQQLEEDFQ